MPPATFCAICQLRVRAEDGLRGDGASVWGARVSRGYAHPQACPSLGTHEERQEPEQVRSFRNPRGVSVLFFTSSGANTLAVEES